MLHPDTCLQWKWKISNILLRTFAFWKITYFTKIYQIPIKNGWFLYHLDHIYSNMFNFFSQYFIPVHFRRPTTFLDTCLSWFWQWTDKILSEDPSMMCIESYMQGPRLWQVRKTNMGSSIGFFDLEELHIFYKFDEISY